MRRIYYVLSAIFALVSCSVDYVRELNLGEEIDLRVTVTKGETITLANFDRFAVSALKENDDPWFEHLMFEKYETTSLFISSQKYYWPGDGSYLSFFAYAPLDDELSGSLTLNNDEQTLKGFEPASSISDQVDFMTASATGNNESKNKVELNFRHNLSQIEIKGKNTNNTYRCHVAGLRIANVISRGDFNFSAQEGMSPWTLSEDKADYEVIFDAPIELGELSESLMGKDGDNAMLIPQELTPWNTEVDNDAGTYFALLVKIMTDSGVLIYPTVDNTHTPKYKDYEWAAIPVNGTWEPGMKYIYNWEFPAVCGYAYPDGHRIMGGVIMMPPPKVGNMENQWPYPEMTYPDAGNN